MNQVTGGFVLMFKCISFIEDFSYCELLCLLLPLKTYIWQEKTGITNWPTESKKKTMFYIIMFIVKKMAGI